MVKAKVLVVGPCQAGKTSICNYLAGASESLGDDYHPTQGVRILEFEVEGESPRTGKSLLVEVELWDCGGNSQFEGCWPAIGKEADGVILVYNPQDNLQDNPQQQRELEKWYMYFVQQHGLSDEQCLILSHHKPQSSTSDGFPDHSTDTIPERLSQIRRVESNLDEDPEIVRDEFNSFLMSAVEISTERLRQEEGSIDLDGDTNF